MRILTGRENTVTALAFSPDGTLLAACGTLGGVHVWDVVSGDLVARFNAAEPYAPFRQLFFVGLRTVLATGSGDIKRYDIAKAKQEKLALYQHTWYEPWHAGYAPATETSLFCRQSDASLSFCHLANNHITERWRTPGKQGRNAMVISGDGTKVASAYAEYDHIYRVLARGVDLLSMEDGTLLACWPFYAPHDITRLQLDATGTLVAGETACQIYVWDTSAETPWVLNNPSAADFVGMAVHPWGTQLATIDKDHLVRLWNTTTLHSIATYTWNVGTPHCIT